MGNKYVQQVITVTHNFHSSQQVATSSSPTSKRNNIFSFAIDEHLLLQPLKTYSSSSSATRVYETKNNETDTTRLRSSYIEAAFPLPYDQNRNRIQVLGTSPRDEERERERVIKQNHHSVHVPSLLLPRPLLLSHPFSGQQTIIRLNRRHLHTGEIFKTSPTFPPPYELHCIY